MLSATEILREDVRGLINHADGKSLRVIKAILEKGNEKEGSDDWWDEMPDEILALIEMSLKESKEGGGIPHEEMAGKHSRWLKK